MSEETKVQKGLNIIEKRPGIRSAELAQAMGIDHKQLCAVMATPVKHRFVVTCPIKRPGQPDTTEWRLSAAVAAADWEQFKSQARTGEAKPLKVPATVRRADTLPSSERQLAEAQQQITALRRATLADQDALTLAKRRVEELERSSSALASENQALHGALSSFFAWITETLAAAKRPMNMQECKELITLCSVADRQRISDLEIAVDAAQMQLKQAGADIKTPVEAAIGYLVRTPKRKPRLCIKPERAKEAAEASAKVHGRSDVLALVPIGTARGRKAVNVEWKEA